MRVKKFEDTVKNSIRKDFGNMVYRQKPTYQRQNEQTEIKIQNNNQIQKQKRINHIQENCFYAKYTRFFINKLVELVEDNGNNNSSGWYKFMYDEDRKALNNAAGWSDNKKIYLLTNPKFK